MNNLNWRYNERWRQYEAEYEGQWQWMFLIEKDATEDDKHLIEVFGIDDNPGKYETCRQITCKKFDTIQAAKLAAEHFIDGTMYRNLEHEL